MIGGCREQCQFDVSRLANSTGLIGCGALRVPAHATMYAMSMVPIMRPKLPPAEAVLPYLQRIDSTRIYSNHGPLAVELKARIAGHFGTTPSNVAMTANATLGLTVALLAQS